MWDAENFLLIDVFGSVTCGHRAERNATKERLCMSSSQLLTITESHGFSAVLAAFAWIGARLSQLAHGLRNLSCGNWQPARMDVGSGTWLLFPLSEIVGTRPVHWFDIVGRRDGPTHWGLRPWHVLQYGSPGYSLALAHAVQAARGPSGWDRGRDLSS
jgi:hypothetical protein